MTITPIFAGLLAILYVGLTAQVIRHRRANQISLNDQGDPKLLQLMRAHGNCAEYAPFGVVLLLLIELQGVMPEFVVVLLGLMLLAGRVAHAVGFSRFPMVMRLRVIGMVLTLTSFLLMAALMLVSALL